MSEMRNNIEYIKQTTTDIEEIAIAENELDNVSSKDIFNDLKELYEIIDKADKDKKFDKYNRKLLEFNNKEDIFKENELNRFCNEIFIDNKIIIEIREKYKRYNFLVSKLLNNNKKDSIILDFNRFSDDDGILAEYNAEFYFKIEDVIDKYNNKKMLLNDRVSLENVHKELEQYKCEVEKEIKLIKKKIDSTKRFF